MKYYALFTITIVVTSLGCSERREPAGPTTLDAGDAATDTATPPPTELIDPPPAISGGTLIVTRDDASAIAADPALDQIFVVDLSSHAVAHTVDLEEGDEPGRLVEDGVGRVHVALRRGGAVVTIDPATGAVTNRRAVCAAPRGIAHRASDDVLIVTCAEGELVVLPAAGGDAITESSPGADLRDVVVLESGELLVSRFRSAEILHLSADGSTVIDTIRLPKTARSIEARRPRPGDVAAFGEPSVAWRMIASPGGALVLHQRATSGIVEVDPRVSGGYGGIGTCSRPPVVQTVATYVEPGGAITVGALEQLVLGVDIALAPTGDRFVVAAPALKQPRGFRGAGNDLLVFDAEPATVTDVIEEPSFLEPPVEAPDEATEPIPGEFEPDVCVFPHRSIFAPGNGVAVAVAYDGTGRLLGLTHGPPRLVIDDGSDTDVLALSTDARVATGHAIFHAATSGGIACASCHPEGGDDGRVWYFSDVGERRTQAFAGALLGTEPFHWSGDMSNFETLAHVVFEGRMGGALLSPDEIDAFARWLDTLEPPPRPAPEDPAAVERGRALFESMEVRCATCHAGPQVTTSATVDVGTGEPLQVPSLIGIHYRAPYMHDGCAEQLRDRFTDPACGGGDSHGVTSPLSDAQLDDLIAYVRTL